MKTFILIIILTFFGFLSCKDSKRINTTTLECEDVEISNVIKTNNEHHIFKIDSTNINRHLFSEKKYVFGKSIDLKYHNNKYYILAKNICKISVFDSMFNKIQNYSILGNGPGELNKITSFLFVKDKIFLTDATRRKNIILNINGKYISEYLISGEEFPYYITGLISNTEEKQIAVGMSIESWNQYTNGFNYHNLYYINFIEQKVLDKICIFPNDISLGLRKKDIISSVVSSPFSITKDEEYIYLFNRSSREVIFLKIKQEKLKPVKKLVIPENLFRSHIPMSIEEFNDFSNPNNSNNWFKSGDNLMFLFANKTYLFFQISGFWDGSNQIKFKILIVNKNTMELKSEILFSEYLMLEIINNKNMIFRYIPKAGNGFSQIIKYSITEFL